MQMLASANKGSFLLVLSVVIAGDGGRGNDGVGDCCCCCQLLLLVVVAGAALVVWVFLLLLSLLMLEMVKSHSPTAPLTLCFALSREAALAYNTNYFPLTKSSVYQFQIGSITN